MEDDDGERSDGSTPSPSRLQNPFQTPIKRTHTGNPKTIIQSPVTKGKYSDDTQRKYLYLLLAETWNPKDVAQACDEAITVLKTLLSDPSNTSTASVEVEGMAEYITTLHKAASREQENGEDEGSGEDSSPRKRQCLRIPRSM